MRLAILLFCCAAALGQTAAPPPSEQKPKAQDYGLGVGAPAGKHFGSMDILSDTRGVDFGPYLKEVLAEIKNNWYRLIPESAATKKGRLAIEFAITKDGKVADMRLVARAEDETLNRAAWGGITASNPFKPLPEEFKGPYLALRMRFYYNPDKSDLDGSSPELESGNFDAAIQKYQQILREKPDSSEAYASLTRIYLKKKDVVKANETIAKAVQVADAPTVRVALGEVYFREGKIHEAEREWVIGFVACNKHAVLTALAASTKAHACSSSRYRSRVGCGSAAARVVGSACSILRQFIGRRHDSELTGRGAVHKRSGLGAIEKKHSIVIEGNRATVSARRWLISDKPLFIATAFLARKQWILEMNSQNGRPEHILEWDVHETLTESNVTSESEGICMIFLGEWDAAKRFVNAE